MAEERTEAAREQSTAAVIETDDLDNLATPESILLSAVSGEDAQDRSDRTILTPWVMDLFCYISQIRTRFKHNSLGLGYTVFVHGDKSQRRLNLRPR